MFMPETQMTVLEHLEELRRRIFVCLLAVLAASAVTYGYSGIILGWLAKPAGSLVFSAPAEAFFIRLKIALFSGLFISMPVVLFQAWKFVVQALTGRERKALVWILPVSYALFGMGAALALFFVIPSAVRFLLAYGSPEMTPLLNVSAYFEFVLALALAFGALFQLPLFLFFLKWLGIMTVRQMAGYRRVVYVASFVLAAFLTPGPDVFSQVVLAVPTILLYEISIFVMRYEIIGP